MESTHIQVLHGTTIKVSLKFTGALSAGMNRSFVASARWDGNKAEFGRLIEYKAVPPAQLAIPNEFLITTESNHEYLYVVLNGNNKVIKQDLEYR
ncbi:MAG: hypothetical protein MZV63_24150 [Marinilabiliales bacterium]|nr:hypothetical protein [Marinilabiliales bacterium]